MIINTDVISLTKDKVWKTHFEGEEVYAKKTSISEVENIRLAAQFLLDKQMYINGVAYNVKVPNIIKWNENENVLIMEECIGENLEIMLRNEETRNEGIAILNSAMMFALNNKFFWHDFAPRNIIVGEKAISFVDFERGVSLTNNIDMRKYLRENVYEEYVAFLMENERPISADRVFNLNNENDYLIDLYDVKSNRIRLIASKLGYRKQIPYSKYLEITQMIVNAEKPFMNDDGTFEFPIIELEEIMSQYGYDKYTDEVIIRNGIYIEEERDV